MILTGKNRKILRESIVSTYPSKEELGILLDEQMDVKFEEIASGNNYNTQIYNLINYLETCGRIQELIEVLVQQKPNSPYLKEIENLIGDREIKTNTASQFIVHKDNNKKQEATAIFGEEKLISGRDMELLHQALTQAFFREEILSQFLRFRMNLDLELITRPGSVSTRISDLIQYLDSQNRIEELLIEAPRFTPNYSLLAQICQGIRTKVFGNDEPMGIDLLPPRFLPGESETLPNRAEVFISYSRKDREYVDRLQTFLQPLIRENSIVLWDDSQILPGERWYSNIESAIARACVAVLMVTADFLSSSFINDVELPKLFEAEKNGLRILWIAVRPSLVKKTKIAQFQAVNNPDRPLSTMSMAIREQELVNIAEKIVRAVKIAPDDVQHS